MKVHLPSEGIWRILMESSLLVIIYPFISLRLLSTQVLALYFLFFNLKEETKRL